MNAIGSDPHPPLWLSIVKPEKHDESNSVNTSKWICLIKQGWPTPVKHVVGLLPSDMIIGQMWNILNLIVVVTIKVQVCKGVAHHQLTKQWSKLKG